MSRRRQLHPLLAGMIQEPNRRMEIVCHCSGARRVVARIVSKNGNRPTIQQHATGAAIKYGENDHTTIVIRCELCGLNAAARWDDATRDMLHAKMRHAIKELALVELARILSTE